MKHKSKINFIIDTIMFIVMMAIGGIGLLMKFILVPGSERWEIYGSNVDLFLWGWDRHEWGSVHLILGYILLGLLVLHIVFHWNQIKSMYRNLIPKKSLRVFLTFLFVVVSILFFLFAFIIDIDVVNLKRGEGGHRAERSRQEVDKLSLGTQGKNVSILSFDKVRNEHTDIEQQDTVGVYGSMTLRYIANAYNLPVDSVKRFLGIPLSLSDNESLGRLRRIYNFHMSDVERFIEKYRKDSDILEISKKEPEEHKHIEHHEHQVEKDIEIYGSMTLKEVENRYNVPADSVKKFLGIPLGISDYENLGRVRRRYGFHMSDVERFIENYRQINK